MLLFVSHTKMGVKLSFVDMSKVVIDTAINLIFTETLILEKMTR